MKCLYPFSTLIFNAICANSDNHSLKSANSANHSLKLAELFSDLHVFDPAVKSWTDISAPSSGTSPSARVGQAFSSAGGMLFVHGGCSDINCIGESQSYITFKDVFLIEE